MFVSFVSRYQLTPAYPIQIRPKPIIGWTALWGLQRSVYFGGLCTSEVCVLHRSVYFRGLCTSKVCVLQRSVYFRGLCTAEVCVLQRSVYFRGLCTLSTVHGSHSNPAARSQCIMRINKVTLLQQLRCVIKLAVVGIVCLSSLPPLS